jgi:pimeloyl-ACP methyl ester carboxylesterase
LRNEEGGGWHVSTRIDEVGARGDVMARLRAFSRVESPSSDHREEQLFLSTSAGRLFCTLVEPTGRALPIALLTCHSFGHEQMELYPVELELARRAASRGFPVLSFQARGYNDSGGAFEEVTMATHVRDAAAAASFLRERTGVEAVVPVGARFGAAVALLVASETEAPGAVLWDPAPEPGRYLDTLLLACSMSAMLDEDGNSSETPSNGGGRDDLKRALARGDAVDVFGYPLGTACYAEAHALHATLQLDRVPERVLCILVNKRRRRELDSTVRALSGSGADVQVEEAAGTGREDFALGMLRGGHLATHRALFQDIADRTIAWVEDGW